MMNYQVFAKKIKRLRQRIDSLGQRARMRDDVFGGLDEVLKELGSILEEFQAKTETHGTERNSAKEMLQVSEEKYRQVVSTTTDAIMLFDADTRKFLEVNKACEELYGYSRDEFLGLRHDDITAEPEKSRASIDETVGGRLNRIPLRYHRKKDGTVFPVEISASTFVLNSRRVLCGVIRDISERRQAEDALRKSEEKYRTLAENTNDIVYTADTAGRITYISPRVDRYGFEPDEIITNPFVDFVFPEDREKISDDYLKTMSTGEEFPTEFRINDKEGRVWWLEEHGKVQRNESGQIIGITGILRDITDRKRAEAQARWYQERLQSLALELSLAEERERRRLATDLHDGIGQVLPVARMKLAMLGQSGDASGRDKLLREIGQLIERADQLAKSLTLKLSHPALYDLGFEAGAEWLAEDIQQLYGLQVVVKDDGQSKPMHERVRVVLFQCLRELLVNTAKHARVEKAQVRINRQGDFVRVTVDDDGVGFDPDTIGTSGNDTSFGLFSIRERLRHLGGRMEIRSSQGKGTTAVLEVPVELDEPQAAGESP